MQRQKVRVMVASEYPETRYLLSKIAEDEPDVMVVGQANNGIRTTILARSLRPDITLIDCNLPYAVGLDTIPLSRIGGLDTALAISEGLPSTQVIVLSNLDVVERENDLGRFTAMYFSREIAARTSRLTLREIYYERAQSAAPIFASIVPREQMNLRERVVKISEGAMLYGSLGILGGLGLMLTIIFAGAGAVLALAGAGTVLLGLAGRLISSLWSKTSSPQREPRVENGAKRPDGIALLKG